MANLMKIIVPVHSFVDVITNSSSEIFVSATDSTVAAAKEIVNNVLSSGGSLAKCDDLFKVSLLYHVRYYDDGEEDTVEKEFDNEADAAKFRSENADKFGGDYDAEWNDLVIEAIDPTNEDAKKAAESLSSFFSTFNTWEKNN